MDYFNKQDSHIKKCPLNISQWNLPSTILWLLTLNFIVNIGIIITK